MDQITIDKEADNLASLLKGCFPQFKKKERGGGGDFLKFFAPRNYYELTFVLGTDGYTQTDIPSLNVGIDIG